MAVRRGPLQTRSGYRELRAEGAIDGRIRGHHEGRALPVMIYRHQGNG